MSKQKIYCLLLKSCIVHVRISLVLLCQSKINTPQIPQSSCLVLTIISIYGKLIMPIAGFHSNSFVWVSFLKPRQDVLFSNLHLPHI